MGDDRHHGEINMNKNFNKNVLENLKGEVTELDFKIKKARQEENWGTYKNIIICYSEILQLVDKYEEEIKNEKDIIDLIFNKYYDNGLFNESINTNELLDLIKKELSINYDCKCQKLSPSHNWEFLNLLSKVTIKILENEIENSIEFRDSDYKHFISSEEIVFEIHNKSFKIEDDMNKSSKFQKFYKSELKLVAKHAKTAIFIKIEDIINGDYDIIEFIKSCISGYVDYIKNEQSKQMLQIELDYNVRSKINFKIGIAGYPVFNYKTDENLLEIDTIIGVGGVVEK